MRAKLLALAAMGLACSGASLAAQPPGAPAFPPDVAAQIPPDLQGYYIALLVNPAQPETMPHDVFIRHLAYLRHQTEAGVYHLAGPFTDRDRIRGIIILSAGSAEQARAIVAADPAVQAGVFSVEMHSILLPSLAGFRIDYPPAAH